MDPLFEKQMLDWVHNIASTVCKECKKNCCENSLITICFSQDELVLFRKADIPIYYFKDINNPEVTQTIFYLNSFFSYFVC